MKQTRILQVWRCPECGAEYHSPRRATEVFCPSHPTTNKAMKLVEGSRFDPVPRSTVIAGNRKGRSKNG